MKIALLQGGHESEREVSFMSAKAVHEALLELGHEVHPLDVTFPSDAWISHLITLRPDLVFNALHGPFGEDGCVQGVLECLGIPYTHSGVEASAIAFNKLRAKELFCRLNIQTPYCVLLTKEQAIEDLAMRPPYVLKHVNGGSSRGLVVVRTLEDLQTFAKDPWNQTVEHVLAEEFIDGDEYTCGILDGEVVGVFKLEVEEDPIHGKTFDYQKKYREGGAKHIATGLDQGLTSAISLYTTWIYGALGCKGLARADFIVSPVADGAGGNGIFAIEMNTQPGLCSVSLVPDMFEKKGGTYTSLIESIVKAAAGR